MVVRFAYRVMIFMIFIFLREGSETGSPTILVLKPAPEAHTEAITSLTTSNTTGKAATAFLFGGQKTVINQSRLSS